MDEEEVWLQNIKSINSRKKKSRSRRCRKKSILEKEIEACSGHQKSNEIVKINDKQLRIVNKLLSNVGCDQLFGNTIENSNPCEFLEKEYEESLMILNTIRKLDFLDLNFEDETLFDALISKIEKVLKEIYNLVSKITNVQCNSKRRLILYLLYVCNFKQFARRMKLIARELPTVYNTVKCEKSGKWRHCQN